MGYGVSVVVENLSRELIRKGNVVRIGCREYEQTYAEEFSIEKLDAEPTQIMELADSFDAEFIIAHTSPYLEVLPSVSQRFGRWVWEHGDPTPELFWKDADLRREIIVNKRANVYPAVERVIVISKFVRTDIGWPRAEVIYNGCDHIPSHEPAESRSGQIKVGTLMRLGKGEGSYKGNELLIEIAQYSRRQGRKYQYSVMGRGTAVDAAPFEEADIKVHLNASDEERHQYLRNLDVFISLSLWEGFDLPVVESQRSGTVAIALDTGAHPEVTPFIVSSVYELESMINAYDQDRELLRDHSLSCRNFVEEKFRWSVAVDSMLKLSGAK